MRFFRPALTTVAISMATVLTACSGEPAADEPTPTPVESASSEAITIGSQEYYSNEIIAELYAQVLEDAGFEVIRDFNIGQREIYMPSMEAGEIDVLPEYIGNLNEFYVEEHTGTVPPDELREELLEALPEGLTLLDLAEATDQDSYTVTSELAEEYKLVTIDDLSRVPGEVRMASNVELEVRPYGPTGAKERYGVDITVVGVEDSGGPLTVKALVDGDVEVANIYTSSAAIEKNDLVVLEDPQFMNLPQNIVPVVSDELGEEAREVLNDLQADLDSDALLELNTMALDEDSSAAVIAASWLMNR